MSISVLAACSGRLDRPTAEQLIGLARAGVDLEVAGVPEDRWRAHLSASGVVFHPLRTRWRLDPEAIRGLTRLLAAKRFDLLHAYNARVLGAALVATRGLPIRIIAFRGYMGNLGPLQPSAWLGFRHPRVDRIVCVSRAVARSLSEQRVLGRRIPLEKIVTIYKGHDPDWYRSAPTDLVSLGVPEGAFTVCYCGRDRPRKGIEVLVDAAGLLDPRLALHYLLVGPMDANRRLRLRIDRSPARDRIHLTGFRTDAPSIAGAADVFVMPSIEREGLSRAVLEAMAQGIPAIVTDAGGLPEQIEHGVSGLVVPQADAAALARAIAELHADRERTRAMGERARRQVVEVFGIDRTVRETIALYEELATSRTR